jgi:hypothetical protein
MPPSAACGSGKPAAGRQVLALADLVDGEEPAVERDAYAS